MKFRCPKCAKVFPAPVGIAAVRCPGCGQELSTKPKLKRTCPECGAPYGAERTACPACGANYKVAGLHRQEGHEPEIEEPGDYSLGMRGCMLILGLALTVVGVILFKGAWEAGWIFSALALLILAGLGLIGRALFASGAAARARAARKARREGHQGPSQ